MSDFETSIKKISATLCEFSIDEIANALFVSSIWLPNIASPIQHQLLVTIFASLKPEQFQNTKKIGTYQDFKNLLEVIYPLLPSFPIIEDYIPSPDWGEVKFHHQGVDYKIFYGTELDNTYDLLQLYDVVYSSFDEEFLKITSRSPKEELKSSLVLQNAILVSITSQPASEELKKISTGSKQIPTETFWNEVSKIYSNFTPLEILNKNFLENYSVHIGGLPADLTSESRFQDMAYADQNIPYLFLKWKESYLLILPRRISEVLIDTWSGIFRKYKDDVHRTAEKYLLRLNAEIYKYVKQRIRSDDVFGLVNVITKKNKPHEILFSLSFTSRDRLVLIYLAEPFVDSDEISKHLESVARKLNKAVKLIGYPPTKLGLNLEKQIIELRSKTKAAKLKPLLLVVIPQVSTQPFGFSLPKLFQGEIVFLDQFLGLVDEVISADEFVSFFTYKKELSEKLSSPMVGLLDVYGSFRDSHGVLVEGARGPDMIVLDPHWGSEMRYESLSTFWSLYPDVGFFDHPRSWIPIKETSTRIRLEARSFFGCAIYSEIGKSKLFVSALFEDLTYEQALITNLLIECLEDSMSNLKRLFENHSFFQVYKQVQVMFFPSGLLKNEKFKHISHLDPNVDGSFWRLERGFPRVELPAVRLVFNEEALLSAFSAVEDNRIEIDLLLAIIQEIDGFVPDGELSAIAERISAQKGGPSRFKLFHVEKEVSFPEHVRVNKPTTYDRKRGRKKVAELAALNGIRPGVYKLEDAKETLNKLRNLVIQQINEIVSECALVSSIPFLIERIDSLENEHEYRKASVNLSLEHEVDYRREEVYSSGYKEFIQNHKLIRYLIEKFIQLQPTGKKILTTDLYLLLICLIEILLDIYVASDHVHYQIYPLGVTIGEDYLINVNYEINIDEMTNKFSEEQARISLKLIGIEEDRIESPRPLEEYLEELNSAFNVSLGFKLANLISVLHLLSIWPSYNEQSVEKTFYAFDLETIVNVCVNNILNIKREEAIAILEFLTLKSEDVLRVLNQEVLSDDLPVWEHRKRYARYTIKPLISLDGIYFWGPYSTRRTGIIWSNAISERSLPFDLLSPEINNVLDSQSRLIEKALEEKALLITKRYTDFAEPNVELHKRDVGYHPLELGDYDVLAYLPKANIILNVECKEIARAYCAKDAKRLREKIFGRPDREIGYLGRVEIREAYLKENCRKIADLLKWPVNPENLPNVLSIFVSREMYWWTMFPTRQTSVVFKRIDLLSQFLEELS
ncbi:MAG: hypothetical protein HY865_23155 [Chloroflexi bacterium]|nr:hypothetical protein [Chloroflexota bacterium]